MSIESVMLSNHLILCHFLLHLPSIFPSIRVFSEESVLHIRWPKHWSFSFSISPSIQDWFPLGLTGMISFAVQGTLKSLLQHHSSKASNLQLLALFIVHLSYPYMTTGKTIALTKWTLVGKVMPLLLNTPSSCYNCPQSLGRRGKVQSSSANLSVQLDKLQKEWDTQVPSSGHVLENRLLECFKPSLEGGKTCLTGLGIDTWPPTFPPADSGTSQEQPFGLALPKMSLGCFQGAATSNFFLPVCQFRQPRDLAKSQRCCLLWTATLNPSLLHKAQGHTGKATPQNNLGFLLLPWKYAN